jgi:hypothetical protein
MKTIKLHIEGKAYAVKPTDTGRINNSITKSISEVTPLELAETLTKGHTAVLATMDGERSNLNMIQQQAVMLDFDNAEYQRINGKKVKCKTEGESYNSIESILDDEYIKENAAFLYTTFSHSAGWDKFRVCFILDKPVMNHEAITAIYESLFARFPNADSAVKDAARIFYGGKVAFEVNYTNELVVTEAMTKTKPAAIKAAKGPGKTLIPVEVPAPVIAAGERKTWELIKAGEKDAVADRLGAYGVTVPSKTSAMTFLK